MLKLIILPAAAVARLLGAHGAAASTAHPTARCDPVPIKTEAECSCQRHPRNPLHVHAEQWALDRGHQRRRRRHRGPTTVTVAMSLVNFLPQPRVLTPGAVTP